MISPSSLPVDAEDSKCPVYFVNLSGFLVGNSGERYDLFCEMYGAREGNLG